MSIRQEAETQLQQEVNDWAVSTVKDCLKKIKNAKAEIAEREAEMAAIEKDATAAYEAKQNSKSSVSPVSYFNRLNFGLTI